MENDIRRNTLPGEGIPGGTGGIGGPVGGMLGTFGTDVGAGTAMTAGGITAGTAAWVIAATGAGGASANS